MSEIVIPDLSHSLCQRPRFRVSPVMTTSIPLLMQFMSSARPKFYDFECCTFDHSDNSPCLFSSGFLSRNLLENSLERKQERRQKIFDFEIFCVEEYQGESRGRNSQLLPKFRVSPVMTASIRFHIRLKHGKTRFAHTILSVLREKVKRFLAKRLTYTGQSGYNNCVL